jgi:hypothetical protein
MPLLAPARTLLIAGLALFGFFLATPRHAWAQG